MNSFQSPKNSHKFPRQSQQSKQDKIVLTTYLTIYTSYRLDIGLKSSIRKLLAFTNNVSKLILTNYEICWNRFLIIDRLIKFRADWVVKCSMPYYNPGNPKIFLVLIWRWAGRVKSTFVLTDGLTDVPRSLVLNSSTSRYR